MIQVASAKYVDSPEDAIAFAARPHPFDLRGIPVVLRVVANEAEQQRARDIGEGPLRSPAEIRLAYRRLAVVAQAFGNRVLVEEYAEAGTLRSQERQSQERSARDEAERVAQAADALVATPGGGAFTTNRQSMS